MKKMRRFMALSSFERRLFVHALMLLPIVRASLVAIGYRRTETWLNCLSQMLRVQRASLDGRVHVEAIDHILHGTDQDTIYRPNVVNAGKR